MKRDGIIIRWLSETWQGLECWGRGRERVGAPSKHSRFFGFTGTGFMSGYFLRAWDEAGMGNWDVSWRVGGLTVSGRYGWRSLLLDAILETSGKCSLRDPRKQVTRRKKNIVIIGPMNRASHGKRDDCQKE